MAGSLNKQLLHCFTVPLEAGQVEGRTGGGKKKGGEEGVREAGGGKREGGRREGGGMEDRGKREGGRGARGGKREGGRKREGGMEEGGRDGRRVKRAYMPSDPPSVGLAHFQSHKPAKYVCHVTCTLRTLL